MAVPLCRFDFQLVSHQSHPLKAQKTIHADQLALYPSPALDVGMAPSLMGQLQERSLATAPSGLRVHDWTRWQAAAADGRAVSKQCSSSPSGPALALLSVLELC